MITGLLGKKIGMTQIFREAGEIVPVTVIEAGPCAVLALRAVDSSGATAVQLGFDKKNPKHVNKPEAGIYKKININPVRFIKEIKTKDASGIKPADNVTVDIFQVGDYVDITGTSIGKGFQGGMKRWHWDGGFASHGSTSHRRPGSIGSSTTPGRVIKGHHLPGHMGNEKVTVQNLEVVEVDKENNLIVVKGAVPGAKDSYLIINKSFRKKRKLPKPKVEGSKKKEDPLKKAKRAAKKLA